MSELLPTNNTASQGGPNHPIASDGEFAFLSKSMGHMDRLQTNNVTTAVAKGTSGPKSDIDEVSVIMAGIKTSDDAINFFARFGSETPVKFIDLVENNDEKNYSPYDLVVTKLSDPMVEHYTMSPAGIVHICPGEPSQCTPLSAFMRQGMMFKILRNIPFYKYFLQRKTLNVWKDNVRYTLFAKQRKKLVDRLFYARKNSCESIITVRKHLMDIQNVRLLNMDLRTCDKDVFIEQQTAQGSKANAKFDEVMRLVITEVQNVMVEVNNIHSLSKQDPNASAMSYSDAAAEKTKSLVKIRQEKAEKKMLRQRAKMEFHTLPEFIRFVDYMSVETLVALAVNTFSAFYEVKFVIHSNLALF